MDEFWGTAACSCWSLACASSFPFGSKFLFFFFNRNSIINKLFNNNSIIWDCFLGLYRFYMFWNLGSFIPLSCFVFWVFMISVSKSLRSSVYLTLCLADFLCLKKYLVYVSCRFSKYSCSPFLIAFFYLSKQRSGYFLFSFFRHIFNLLSCNEKFPFC